jgi:multiple sugar transport system substrate-binding protein
VTGRLGRNIGGGVTRPRFSTLALLSLALTVALLVACVFILDRAAAPRGGHTVVNVRLWDEKVAVAYRESFAAFSRTHPDIEVRADVVAYGSYFDSLRTDVAGGSADDIFWLPNAYLAAYADSGRLMKIDADLDWEPSVVALYTRGGTLWGVPQLTDGNISLYYNADMLAAAGVDPAALATLRWSPDGDDTLRPLLARLTVDVNGRTAGTTGFDPLRVRQWGYNAANDSQDIYLDFIGSAGGVFQRGDKFAFDNPAAITAFRYVIGLINDDHVAPPASETNTIGDFARNQFVAGRMALFQSGTYNLAPVADAAPRFHWGVTVIPAGPVGRATVTNGIAAVGNAVSPHPEAVRQVLAWLGSRAGNEFIGRRGSAIPAVRSAQQVYFDYWAGKGVDVSAFFAAIDGPRIPVPGGAGFPAGDQALRPYFDEMFAGRTDIAETLKRAQAAANAAAGR